MDLDRRRRDRHRCWALAVALAAGAACAQQDPTLSAVTVTVNRGVAQSSFDAPASVDVIEGEVLRTGQLQVNLSESLARVPGLVVQNRHNYAQDLQISIRGFGARSTFGVRGIRLYADGIPASGPDGQGQVSHFDLSSAARVEVLRGPFSALYGNSSGGVVSLFTADGGPETVADLSSAFGSDGLRRHGVRLSGAQGGLQYHLSTSHFRTGGWREHSAAERTTFNGKLRYALGEDTHMTLVLNSVDMPGVQDPLGLTRAEFEADPRQVSPNARLFDTRKSVGQHQAGAILDHRIDADRSLQVTLYRGERDTLQFQSIPVAAQAAPSHPGGVIDLARRYQGLDARWIQKSRWLAKPVTVTAGVSADEVREHRRGFQNFAGPQLGVAGALRRDEANRARNFDQYLQAEWTLAERWSLSAGARHSVVTLRSRDRYAGPGNADDSGSVRYEATTPALGLVFHASEALNLYAAYGRGFETPTLNEISYRPGGLPGLNFGLREARSRQWEAGAKARLGEAWRLNAALFQARTEGEIVVLGNTGGRSVFQNAGSTERDGLEAVLSGRWGRGWSAHLAATWLKARYGPGTALPAGNRLPGVPRASLYAELGWEHRPWGLQAAVEWRHTGRVAVDDANSDWAAGSQAVNLRASLTQQVGRWKLTEFLRIDNVADRAFAGSVIVNEGNRRFFEPAPGRTWAAGVSAAYPF